MRNSPNFEVRTSVKMWRLDVGSTVGVVEGCIPARPWWIYSLNSGEREAHIHMLATSIALVSSRFHSRFKELVRCNSCTGTCGNADELTRVTFLCLFFYARMGKT